MNNPNRIEQLARLAQEGEGTDPIDWGYLNIDENTAYNLMASHVLEMDTTPQIMQATIVKLLVENFVLNLKLEIK